MRHARSSRTSSALLKPIGADTLLAQGGGADIGPIMQRGVPGMSHVVDGTKYFLVPPH
jgi:carboxypeptidase Q